MKLKKFYNWYEEKIISILIALSIILVLFCGVFVTVNGFIVDFSNDYKSMSQAFEENRESVCELINPNTNIDMCIGKNNEYNVYSDSDKKFIEVTLSTTDKYSLLKDPAIEYPIAINNGTYVVSEEYIVSDDVIINTFSCVFFLIIGTVLSFFLSFLITISFEKILELLYTKKTDND